MLLSLPRLWLARNDFRFFLPRDDPSISILLSIHSTTARYGNRGRKTGTRRTRSPVFSSNNRPPRPSPSITLAPLFRVCKSVYLVSNSGFFSVETVIKSSTTDYPVATIAEEVLEKIAMLVVIRDNYIIGPNYYYYYYLVSDWLINLKLIVNGHVDSNFQTFERSFWSLNGELFHSKISIIWGVSCVIFIRLIFLVVLKDGKIGNFLIISFKRYDLLFISKSKIKSMYNFF